MSAASASTTRRLRIAGYIAWGAGLLLFGVGVLHDILNIPSLLRAIARGDVAERMGAQLVANVAFGGLALALLGILLLLVAPDLAKGRRTAWRIGVVIGLFLVFDGIAAYWWLPRAAVLIFSVAGALLCGPLLLWRRDFPAD